MLQPLSKRNMHRMQYAWHKTELKRQRLRKKIGERMECSEGHTEQTGTKSGYRQHERIAFTVDFAFRRRQMANFKFHRTFFIWNSFSLVYDTQKQMTGSSPREQFHLI